MQAAAEQLSYRLGPGVPYELAIRYDRLLDPALDLPSVRMARSRALMTGQAVPPRRPARRGGMDCPGCRVSIT